MVDRRRVSLDLFTEAGADFDGSYRYDLFRKWGQGPMLLFVMLNPSTADEFKLDRTVARCRKLAMKMDFGSFHVVNMFALISTDPKKLEEVDDPVGKLNGRYIGRLAKEAEKVIVAWGSHKLVKSREAAVLKLLHKHHKKLYCLGVTKKGHPRHPLYVPSSAELVKYDGESPKTK